MTVDEVTMGTTVDQVLEQVQPMTTGERYQPDNTDRHQTQSQIITKPVKREKQQNFPYYNPMKASIRRTA